MNDEFCHLHVHSEYSLLDGYGSAEAYAKAAKGLGFDYLACTDHGSVDGLIKFQKACLKEGIKPVLGCEAYIVPDPKIKEKQYEKRGHITLLVENEKGWQNLCQMLTKANLEGFYYRPRIGHDDLYDNSEGLVILTGCMASFLNHKEGVKFFKRLVKKDPDRIFLEVMPHIDNDQTGLNELCLDLSGDLRIPLVATNDCHYIEEKDWEAQEVLLAIQSKAKWTDPDRFRFKFKGLFLRSEEQMLKAFKKQDVFEDGEIKQALHRTIEIAKICSKFQISKQGIYLPAVPGYEKVDHRFLLEVAYSSLDELIDPKSKKYKVYKDRLLEEWSIIEDKKFTGYFLIVYELVNWCKKQDIMIGPGRGSVGGSLLAYLLGITAVDPLKYDLLFSRFINPDRIDYPDIDIDFEDRKRPLIREHLEELYGKNKISSISTFLTMKGRAALRDVARVYDVPLGDTDSFSKAIDYAGEENAIERAVEETSEGKAFDEKYPKVVDMAIRLEGQVRGAGQHAAAIVVSADDLSRGTRGNLSLRSKMIVSNWDMEDSEYVGLMKLDILGLNTLSILNETAKLAQDSKTRLICHPESDSVFVGDVSDLGLLDGSCSDITLDFDRIPLNDKAVFQELSEGNTVGVFQMNTWAGTKLCKELGVKSLRTIYDQIAIVRPGPYESGMTEMYIERAHGKKWEKKHPLFEEITKETYGLIIYQEQIMEVIHKIAGLPYSTADTIRKIIGKKRDAREFKPYREAFIEGCRKMKMFDDKEAEEFWEVLQKHAHYSFNKSHSVEYAIIAYWTAFCKIYWPTEFISASLTYGPESKKEELVEEAKRLGLKIMLPRIGFSDAEKWVVKDDVLYVPFIEIKGIGNKGAIQCAEAKPINKDKVLKGFFSGKEKKPKGGGRYENILLDVGAYGDPPTSENLKGLFVFDISGIGGKIDKRHRTLLDITKGEKESVEKLSSLEFDAAKYKFIKKDSFQDKTLNDCVACDLANECQYGPVLPSKGKYNLVIGGEAPGEKEDEKGEGFKGKAGELLWKELGVLGYDRSLFHVSNIVKCYPRKSKTPSKEQIEICKHWFLEEIKALDAKLILAFGNTSLKALIGKDAGIKDRSGSTQWIESIGAWVCWCIHPSAVLHNPTQLDLLKDGLKNFADKIERMGGI